MKNLYGGFAPEPNPLCLYSSLGWVDKKGRIVVKFNDSHQRLILRDKVQIEEELEFRRGIAIGILQGDQEELHTQEPGQ